MSDVTNNPCCDCDTNQHCCSRLSGLLLSEDEFGSHFACHQDELSVRRSGRVVSVTAKNGGACPHWSKDGCRIYRERPIDCRVFPYVPTHVIDRGGRTTIVFHGRSDCPQKERLFRQLPETEVRALLLAFGRKLYGETRPIVVRRENGLIARLCNRIEAAICRRLHQRRSQ